MATGWTHRPPPRSRAACGWRSCCSRLAHEPPADEPSELRLTIKRRCPGLPGRVLAGSGATPWPTTAQPRRRGRGAGPADRTVALAPARPRAGAGRVRRLVTATDDFERFFGRLVAAGRPTDVLTRLADSDLVRRRRADWLSNAECDLLAASYADLGERPDWTVADGALLDELGHCSARYPRRRSPRPSLFLDPDAEAAESSSHRRPAECPAGAGPSATTRRDVCAHPGRRGAGHLADAVADAPAPRPQASWTIVGDPAQSSWPDAEEAERAITEMVGPRRSASSG